MEVVKRFINRGSKIFGCRIDPEMYPYIEYEFNHQVKAFAITPQGQRVPCPKRIAFVSIGKEVKNEN